jgi:hypothetical protein
MAKLGDLERMKWGFECLQRILPQVHGAKLSCRAIKVMKDLQTFFIRTIITIVWFKKL